MADQVSPLAAPRVALRVAVTGADVLASCHGGFGAVDGARPARAGGIAETAVPGKSTRQPRPPEAIRGATRNARGINPGHLSQ